jgi:hypothetical protein
MSATEFLRLLPCKVQRVTGLADLMAAMSHLK